MNRIKNQKDYAPLAKTRILELLQEKNVATEREIKVNLERDPVAESRWNIRGFFPWVIGFAIQALLQEEKIESHGYGGRIRLGSGTPAKFYSLKSVPYPEIEGLIAEKRRISKYINALLTEQGVATIHAEEIIREAFEQLNFKFIDRDVSKLGNKEVKPPPTGPPPNVDFVFEKR